MPKIFLADAMLKKLARWLRIFGAETIYPENIGDSHLLSLSEKQNLILLTQDVELAQRAQKRKIQHLLIPRNTSLEQQLSLVIKTFGLPLGDFPSKTLCPKCNGRLIVVREGEVEGKVYADLLGRNKVFWACEKCRQIYWEGSHWEKITKTAEKIKKLLSD